MGRKEPKRTGAGDGSGIGGGRGAVQDSNNDEGNGYQLLLVLHRDDQLQQRKLGKSRDKSGWGKVGVIQDGRMSD